MGSPQRRRSMSACWVSASLLVIAVLPGTARAGFPLGVPNVLELEHDAVRHVCSNAPAIVCLQRDTPNFFRGLYTAAECPNPASAPTCVIDFVPNAEIRGVLTIVADDRRPDLAAYEPGDDFNTTLLFEFTANGKDFVVADTFHGVFGRWFAFDFVEPRVSATGLGGAQFFPGSLQALKTRLQQIAASELGVAPDSVPVMLEALSTAPSSQSANSTVHKGPEADASADDDPLATVVRFRVTLRFAPPAP